MDTPTEGAQVYRFLGVLPAGLILGSWILTLLFLLRLEPLSTAWFWSLGLIPLATFLYTGLFITAHDAMHGTLAPGSRRLNDAFGRAAVILYALFSFERLVAAHRRHHATPGVEGDPDWHDGRRTGFWAWYAAFMARYLTWRQLVGMAIAYNVMAWVLHVPQPNLVAFWVAPSLLSTLQLFYFGTYRVHKEPPGGHDNPHNATTSRFPLWLSFLTCYHFGLHREHHEQPHLPWWRLPEALSS